MDITSDRTSIDLISFSKPEVELREIGNNEWINEEDGKAFGFKEVEKVKVIRSGGFDSYEGLTGAEVRDVVEEGMKAGAIHGKMGMRFRELVRYDARVEVVLGNIDADESKHAKHSFREILAKQGVSEPILHRYESLKAQPTYYGLGDGGQTPKRALKLR